MDSIINGIALLIIFIGGGVFIVNAPGGSGFDAGDVQAGLPVRHRADWVFTTPKLIPRFRQGVLVGTLLILAGIALAVFNSWR